MKYVHAYINEEFFQRPATIKIEFGNGTAREKFMIRIGIIIGSTRPGRNGEAVAKWVYEIAQKHSLPRAYAPSDTVASTSNWIFDTLKPADRTCATAVAMASSSEDASRSK